MAEHGWPVIPGARLVGDRFSCGPGCRTVSCHPGFAHPTDGAPRPHPAALRDPDLVASTWRRTPHAILLATGVCFDVLEAPAWLVQSAGRRQMLGPVALTPTGRWMFLVRPGGELRPELAALHDVVLHGEDSWIPAPPTRTPQGRVRWVVSPAAADWRPTIGALIQSWLVEGLPLRRRPRYSSERAA